MTHSCIKCKTQYEEEDTEAYLCASCLEEKKRIAAEIDARLASRPRKEQVSAIQAYDQAPKGPGGFMIVKL